MTEVLGLVTWLVYVSDALWWMGPDRIVLSGRAVGHMRAQLGPAVTVRQDSGVFVPKLTPAFDRHFEVSATVAADEARGDDVIIATATAAMAAARPLERLGTLLWGFGFLVAPALMVLVGLRRVWIALVAVLLGGAIAIAASVARAWRQLHPEDPRSWRREALPMILSPLAQSARQTL